MSVWRNSVMAWSDAAASAAVPLDDLVRRGHVLRQHHFRLAVLPLADQELALGASGLVPAQWAEDRVDIVVPQPVGELRLLIALDRADGLYRRLHDLRRRERVGRVLGDLGAAEHLLVLGDEFLVARRLGLRRMADGVEDALRRLLADALDVLVAERRRARLEEHLRLKADLLHGTDEADAVGEGRPVNHDVRVLP